MTPKSQNRPTRWAVITKGGGRVVVEAETAEAAWEKAERRGYFVLEVNRDASDQAVSFLKQAPRPSEIPMGRLGDPHLDIAPALLFLATDDARYITGQTLGVDGGSFLHA